MSYLYNGVELPQLPEWDKAAYPYAYISCSSYIYRLFVTDTALAYDDNGGVWSGGETINYIRYYRNGDGWTLQTEYNDSLSLAGDCIWTNTDLYTEDGSIYLAASDPIPVTSFTPDPISMTLGWIVGRRIAGQRGRHIHQYIQEVIEPTCTEGGYTTFTCSCGDSYTGEETDALGHEYVSEVIEPTTEAEGYTLHTCSRCGDSYKDNYTDKLPGEPIAYLYNGVQLPDINEVWDGYRTSYPYAYIWQDVDSDYDYKLILVNNWAYYSKNYSGSNDIGRDSGMLWRNYALQNGEWVLLYAPTSSSGLWFCDLDGGDSLVWASYDVKNGDEILLAASDPVPVYES